jgi:ATP-dependent Zn protease
LNNIRHTGADIAEIVNSAKLEKMKKGVNYISMKMLLDAVDTITLGIEERSRAQIAEQQRLTGTTSLKSLVS